MDTIATSQNLEEKIKRLKQKNQQLKIKNKRISKEYKALKTALNSLSDAVIITDPEGQIKEMNSVADNLTTISIKDAQGKLIQEVFDFVDSSTIKKIDNLTDLVLRKSMRLTEKQLTILNNGNSFRMADASSLIKNKQGTITGIVFIFKDANHQNRIQKRLQENRQRLKKMFEAAEDGIIVSNLNSKIIEANKAAAQMVGLQNEEELIGRSVFDFVCAEDKETARKLTQETIEQGQVQEHREFRAITKQGEVIFTHTSAGLLLDENDRPSGVINIVRDVTDRKKAEEENQKLQEQLLQSQKLKSIGTLASGVAHDFNNILTVILGVTQLGMNQITESNSIYSSLESIYEAAERASKLTEQLLLFSRKKEMEFKIINLNNVVSRLEKMLDRLIGEDITMYNNFANDLWKVKADENQIEQVITNLVVNARDAMPQGGDLTVSTQNVIIDEEKAKTIPDIKPGQYVRLYIEDNGEGMDKSVQEKIFDPFFTTKGRSQGTGMGLSVAHGIIKKHDGLINVYSEPGEGTIFKIYLPAQKNAVESDEKANSENLAEYKGQGEIVLVVEDDKPVLEYLENMLTNYNYKFYSTQSGEEAFKVFENKKDEIDLLISDVIMNGISGIELANKIKAHKEDVKVILSSGYSGKKVAPSNIRDKGYKFIQKPYDIKKLLKLIRHSIEEE
ncbi:MAG: PAS domain S-box protein [Candidatus Marinimicrobia bacterium]|nr:PAS domain S-box protein [Candidatus Neomarinimicrobiota bacterium]